MSRLPVERGLLLMLDVDSCLNSLYIYLLCTWMDNDLVCRIWYFMCKWNGMQ